VPALDAPPRVAESANELEDESTAEDETA
jgi:hypothetical protein